MIGTHKIFAEAAAATDRTSEPRHFLVEKMSILQLRNMRNRSDV